MQELIDEALNHRAINHPYLLALKNGEFSNNKEILKDFAAQYGAYSSWFPRYLTAVISKLENPTHREHLLDNLAEESGHLHEEDIEAIAAMGIKEEWVQGIPHPKLFRRFQTAMGIEHHTQNDIEVEIWRESFLSLAQDGTAATAVGAIGLGTESIVKYIYRHLIEAIENYTDLKLEEYVFFPLHTEVDDEHGKTLLRIAEELSSDNSQAFHDLRKGMLMALNLRAAYWDGMLARMNSIHSKSQVHAS
jgi:pyrroloquinoline quinone (PQQ) biosynthesis protein C